MTHKSHMALKIGDKVKLTGKFLKSTGQGLGREGQKSWTVVGFWLNNPEMVFVNEPVAMPEMYADLPESERPKWRTINAANLFKVGTLTSRNCP